MTNEQGQHEEMILLKKNNGIPRLMKKYGITDTNILCRKCDDEILGKYENKFKEVWERVFKKGELYPIEKEGRLTGWAKEIIGKQDIITTKLFLLACIWRAAISQSEDYPLKINSRKEAALKRALTERRHEKLLHSYSMICSKFEDENYPLAISPSMIKGPRKHLGLIRFCLPLGYIFTIRLGQEKIDEKIGVEEFGAFSNCFFIANSGKLKGSESEKRLFKGTLKNLQEMYPGDKRKIGKSLLEQCGDITEEEIKAILKYT